VSRQQTLEGLACQPLDVLVVGGGIVGAGVARDAAMRGLRVGLVEQHDIAYGTSSRSSRLLHGGLRYLAQGRIGLVHEASVEKRVVHRIAPHISEPLAFIFPTYRTPPWGTWALWKLAAGVKIYDLLCGGRNLGASSWLSASRLKSILPGVRPDDLTGAVRYYDGLTNDARLVTDTLRSAEASGALVLNYARMETSSATDSQWQCSVMDMLTGRSFQVKSRCVVNATGPWAEMLEHSAVRLRPTKGVHLVIPRCRLPIPDAVVMTEGSRILFAIPWGERVILGTTDTDYQGRIEDVRVEPEDVSYVLKVVNCSFPEAGLTEADLVSGWAGLRPLIADPNGGPSDISRGHEIRTPAPGWWDVAGGKLTTYRLMAEQTMDQVQRFLGHPADGCSTATEPLLSPEEVAGVSAIVPPQVTREAVAHYCRREWVVHLDDVMVRRAGWHYYHTNAAEIAAQVADWMADELGWDETTKQTELSRYLSESNHPAEPVVEE